MRHKHLLVAATVAFVSIGASTGNALAAQDPECAIRATLEKWRLDFNARKSAHICDLFSPHLRYDFRGLPEQNYPLLCARLHRALGDNMKTFRYGLRVKEIIVSGSLAAVRLTWISTISLPRKKSRTDEEPGLDIFQRQPDGRWLIIRYLAYEND